MSHSCGISEEGHSGTIGSISNYEFVDGHCGLEESVATIAPRARELSRRRLGILADFYLGNEYFCWIKVRNADAVDACRFKGSC
jgi:hypothetical protein